MTENDVDTDDDVITSDDDGDESGRAVPEAWRNKRLRISAIAAAVILAAGVGFGVGRAMGLGDLVVLSAIPGPARCVPTLTTTSPATACAFVEDDEGIGQDNQANILNSSGDGIVHVLSGGTPVGIGLVLTQSGKVLTTYQPSPGATNLAAEFVLAHQTFKAKVIGVDPAAGLALLQMEGSNGRAFSTVTVGNSDTIVSSANAIRQSSYHVPGEVIDTAVSTTGTEAGASLDVGKLTTLNMNVDIDGTTWTGLMASTLPSALPWVLGDPLVNPNGHVIGIVIGNSRSGFNTVAYAIPINAALAVATQIADGNS